MLDALTQPKPINRLTSGNSGLSKQIPSLNFDRLVKFNAITPGLSGLILEPELIVG